GPPPCKNSPINAGALRYGNKVHTEQYGEIWSWRRECHMRWGCVTPDILQQLKAVGVSTIAGYSSLASHDKTKVATAIRVGHIDPADVPRSARPLDWSQMSSSQSSQPGPSTSSGQAITTGSSQAGLSSSQAGTTSQTFSLVHESDDEYDVPMPEEVPKDDHYLDLQATVVGIQYYKGLVNSGEEVNLARQPSNQYDRCQNMAGVMVGHLKREIAAKLAPLIDQNLILVEGIINAGNTEGGAPKYDMPMQLYGCPGMRKILEPKLIWATPRQRGFTDQMRAASSSSYVPPNSQLATTSGANYGSYAGYGGGGGYGYGGGQSSRSVSGAIDTQAMAQFRAKHEAEQKAREKAAQLRDLMKEFETVNDESRRSSMLDALIPVDDILNLPEMVNPPPPSRETEELQTDLMKHQKQALKWMLEMENPVLPVRPDQQAVQFWKYVQKSQALSFYENIASHQARSTTDPPTLGRGGLMADSMGLGKTLSMISLIVATRKDLPKAHSNCTLIVAPVSVLRTWDLQVKEHCAPGLLRVYTYHDKSRDIAASQLQKYDIVITSYSTVAGEYTAEGQVKKKRGGNALFGLKWKVRSLGNNLIFFQTKIHKAVVALDAERRWLVSGTPIINSPKDLGAILSFLRICAPLDDLGYFNRALIRPLNRGDPAAANLLQALMVHMCLRRTKEMQDSDGNPLVKLPGVEITTIRVELDPEARRMYDEVRRLSQEGILRQIQSADGSVTIQAPANALSMLTRMRQLILHPGLVPSTYVEELRNSLTEGSHSHSTPSVVISAEERRKLQNKLFQVTEDNEECPVCFDALRDAVITPCAHAFCRECITAVLQRDPKCPMDRREIQVGDLIEALPPTDSTQAQIRVDIDDDQDAEDNLRNGSSAKIDALIRYLQLTRDDEKSVVFSQFTSFLDKIAEQLEKAGIPFVRFDGSMSAHRRQAVIDRFNIPLAGSLPDPPKPSIDLPSLPSDDEDMELPPIPTRRGRAKNSTSASGSDDYDPSAEPQHEDDEDEGYDDASVYEESEPPSPQKGKAKAKAKAKGKGKGKAKVISFADRRDALLHSYDVGLGGGDIPKVLLISLKAGALGLQLTVANNVYLMDPWWQEGIETQAIDRCNRIGQKRKVHVYQMIADDTIESRVLEIQEKKKDLVKQAFSGTKAKETQRQKKEARMQGQLIVPQFT
ncbi:hypothetical protein DL93DRAFT_2054681, partial [Clavulina sp. PMI_390]